MGLALAGLVPDQVTSHHSYVTFSGSRNFYFLPVRKQVQSSTICAATCSAPSRRRAARAGGWCGSAALLEGGYRVELVLTAVE